MKPGSNVRRVALQQVKSENIRWLENGKISEDETFVEGRDPNSILQDAFSFQDIRPSDFEEKIDKITLLIDEENEDAAKNELNNLKKIWGENDREIQRLALHIDLI